MEHRDFQEAFFFKSQIWNVRRWEGLIKDWIFIVEIKQKKTSTKKSTKRKKSTKSTKSKTRGFCGLKNKQTKTNWYTGTVEASYIPLVPSSIGPITQFTKPLSKKSQKKPSW